ncbi:MAG: dTDP-4-dehydrorhamnose 3,5-epimerase family protein [Chloroflexi bacterium]|nr:dTDP-4-dehydrorhamnose 3,5-epimerase family protein [Chloroflexota bacterium]
MTSPQERARQYILETTIPGLLVLERPTHRDQRGFFREVFHVDELEAATGATFPIAQWNHSLSLPGVIRALHAEGWNKLVYPVSGTMFAAIADIRPDSPTFAGVATFTFDDDCRRALFIPKGLANSICVLGDQPVNYLYLVDAYYDGKDTTAVAWDDPDLAVPWPIQNPIISERDRHNPRLRDLVPQRFR